MFLFEKNKTPAEEPPSIFDLDDIREIVLAFPAPKLHKQPSDNRERQDPLRDLKDRMPTILTKAENEG